MFLGAVTSRYDTDAVLMAAGITAVITLGLTIFALQTKVGYPKTISNINFYYVLHVIWLSDVLLISLVKAMDYKAQLSIAFVNF